MVGSFLDSGSFLRPRLALTRDSKSILCPRLADERVARSEFDKPLLILKEMVGSFLDSSIFFCIPRPPGESLPSTRGRSARAATLGDTTVGFEGFTGVARRAHAILSRASEESAKQATDSNLPIPSEMSRGISARRSQAFYVPQTAGLARQV